MANTENVALTEGVYYILLSLLEPLHGYGIMQKVEGLSQGRVVLAAGTLYGALSSLTEKGWIQAMEENSGRKKEYCITDEGKEKVRREIQRLEELLQNGKMMMGGDNHDA